MSTIKKYFRQILCIAGFLLMAIVFAFNPSLSAFAQETTSQTLDEAISSVHIPTQVVDLSNKSKDDDQLIIPLITGKKVPKQYTIVVTEPGGAIKQCEINTDDKQDTDYFEYTTINETKDAIKIKSLLGGIYNISYFYTSENGYYNSLPFSVEVKNVNYEFDFVDEDGNKGILPNSAKNNQKIIIPNAYLKIVGTDDYLLEPSGERVVVTPTVEKDTVEIYPTGHEQNPDVELIEDAESEYNNMLRLTTSLGKEKHVTYTIYYTYLGGQNVLNYSKEISVSEDYKNPKTLDINTVDFPSMELGQKGITLPEWTASTEYENNVDVNITKIVIQKEGNSNIKLELLNNNRTFDFTKENFNANSYKEMVGNYSIEYFLESAYGDEGNKLSNSAKKTVLNVTDKTAPSVYMAYSYELENGKWAKEADQLPVLTPDEEKNLSDVKVKNKEGKETPDVNTDYAVELKSNYGYGELAFPAIYAEDLVNSYDELVFVRYFQRVNDPNDRYYIDNVMLDEETHELKVVPSTSKGYNASGDTNIGVYNRVVRFKFNVSDSYKIEDFIGKEYSLHYYVYVKDCENKIGDNLENEVYVSGRTAYTFNVLSRVALGSETPDVEGVSKPSISINDLINNSFIDKDAETTITVKSTDDLDKRLKNAVFYYTGTAQQEDTVLTDLKTELNKILLKYTWQKLNDPEEVVPNFDDYTCNVLDSSALTEAMANLAEKSKYKNFARLESTDNNSFVLKLNFEEKEQLVNIVAVTLNDNNTIAIATKTLKIKDTSETKAPLLVSVTDNTEQTTYLKTKDANAETDNKFTQYDVVYLPTVVFSDEDKSLDVSVRYYVLSEEDITNLQANKLFNLTFEKAKGVDTSKAGTISKAKIVTDKVGTYYVVYTAKDDAGNQTYAVYSFTVEPKVSYKLDVTPYGDWISKNNRNIEAKRDSVLVFQPKLTKNNADITDTEGVEFSVTGTAQQFEVNAEEAGLDYSLRFIEVDQYEVVVTAKVDGLTISSDPYHVTISDPELVWDFDVQITDKAGIGDEIYLPVLTASYGISKVSVPVTLTIKDPDNKDPEWGNPVRDEKTGYWVFKFNGGTKGEGDERQVADPSRTQKGTYKGVYTAEWDGRTITKPFEIKVGDRVPPEFTFNNDVSGLEQDIVFDGSDIEYTVDLVRYPTSERTRSLIIRVVSNGKKVYEIDTGLEINDKDGSVNADGTMVTSPYRNWAKLQVELRASNSNNLEENANDNYEKQYLIKGIGKYTLVLTMTDNYNNTSTKEFSFNVVAKSEPKETNDNVVGIVLIVISLVILAGVILFFTFTGKKGGSGKTKSTKTKKLAETSVETDSDAKSGDVE